MSRLVSFYGDDFTGSTDVMESLGLNGIETVLFTRIPTASEFAPFSKFQGMGLAGCSRSQSPAWMNTNLPPLFEWLRSLDAKFNHYKVCSTFDSSPAIGNIGRAIEIGAKVFNQSMIPLLVGAPQLKRYTFAGQLFAAYQGQVHRIDRHPVMARHPVTPMDEADLRLHLARQTELPIALASESWPDQGIGLLDVYDMASQLLAGQKLLALHRDSSLFIAGSSGVEYALARAMAAANDQSLRSLTFEPLQPCAQTIVVSGSVSPTTERQIRQAQLQGFEALSVSALGLASDDDGRLQQQCVDSALMVLDTGRSPLIHTALGSSSDAGHELNVIPAARQKIGERLGLILRQLLEKTKIRRAIIAGGDSSSHAVLQLDVHALTLRRPLPATPGSPLCLAHSSIAKLNGIELALKGGQLGSDNYFADLRDART